MKNIIDSESFPLPARVAWMRISPAAQEAILSNVWCVNCSRAVCIEVSGGKIEQGALVLQGCCAECGGAVARVIEPEGK